MFAAPRIEPPRNARKTAIRLPDESRAGIADPAVIDGDINHRGMIAEHGARRLCVLGVSDHVDRLELGDGCGDLHIAFLNGFEVFAVQISPVRPGHPCLAVRLEIRRTADAASKRGSIHWFVADGRRDVHGL